MDIGRRPALGLNRRAWRPCRHGRRSDSSRSRCPALSGGRTRVGAASSRVSTIGKCFGRLARTTSSSARGLLLQDVAHSVPGSGSTRPLARPRARPFRRDDACCGTRRSGGSIRYRTSRCSDCRGAGGWPRAPDPSSRGGRGLFWPASRTSEGGAGTIEGTSAHWARHR